MPVRIAVWHNLPSGGGKRALYYHVRGLVERGHHVEIWCPQTANREYLALGEFATEHVMPLDPAPGLASRLAARSSVLQHELRHDQLRAVRALDAHCRACAGEIDRGGFDVLFANSSLFQAVSAIGRLASTTSVLYLQEPSRHFYEAGGEGLPWIALPPANGLRAIPAHTVRLVANAIGTQQLRVIARDERLNAAAFDTILVNSLFSRESLLRAYGLDSTVCHLGVDSRLFAARHRPRERLVVSLGEINPHKNVGFIIEAMGAVAPPRPDLVWIGNTSHQFYRQTMQQLASSLGVRFEPRTNIADAELVDLLNRAAVMAYAPRLEPFGFAPLEANACGLPVVAVAEGGVRETVAHDVNGLLVPNEPAAMAKAIETLLADPAYAARLGAEGARQVAERWSLDAAVERLEVQLDLAVARSGQRAGHDRRRP
jgi:glycosyltransferase involved in cell wall biosynthesis